MLSQMALLCLSLSQAARAAQQSVAELEAEVESLSRQLEQANARLAAARALVGADAEELADTPDITGKGIRIGPVTIGGAMRVNYIYGDYVESGPAPQRGGNGGNQLLGSGDVGQRDDDRAVGKEILELLGHSQRQLGLAHTGRPDQGEQTHVGLQEPFARLIHRVGTAEEARRADG